MKKPFVLGLVVGVLVWLVPKGCNLAVSRVFDSDRIVDVQRIVSPRGDLDVVTRKSADRYGEYSFEVYLAKHRADSISADPGVCVLEGKRGFWVTQVQWT